MKVDSSEDGLFHWGTRHSPLHSPPCITWAVPPPRGWTGSRTACGCFRAAFHWRRKGPPLPERLLLKPGPHQVAQGNQRKVKISVTNKMTEYMGSLQASLEMNSLGKRSFSEDVVQKSPESSWLYGAPPGGEPGPQYVPRWPSTGPPVPLLHEKRCQEGLLWVTEGRVLAEVPIHTHTPREGTTCHRDPHAAPALGHT